MNQETTSPQGEVPRLFGTDGIRDIAGSGKLAPDVVARVGRALVRFARGVQASRGEVRVLLGRDPRPSGQDLTRQLAVHMAAEGARVFDAGVLPSPALAWLTAAGDYTLGCSISASHNPPEYNGIKPFHATGRKLSVEDEGAVEALAASAEVSGEVGPLPMPALEAREAYVRETLAYLRPGGTLDGLHLIVDLSAGAATETAPFVLESLGARVDLLHAAGSRPINEHCGSEHPDALVAAVKASGASAGLAFDGDADRVVVIDETGVALDGDDLLAILAADLHARGGVPGRSVVSTVMANLGLQEFLEPFDVGLERTPVGDRNVAERMHALGSVLGGEQAGHIVRPRTDLPTSPALIGDGLVAGVETLQAARRSGEALSAWRAKRKRYPQLLVNVRMAERRPLDAWPAFQHELAVQEAALEGIGRLVVRYSGTEPLLRIMAEGRDPDAVRAAVEALADVARSEGVSAG